MDYVAPTLNAKAYTCPHCQVYAQQHWSPIMNNEGPGPSKVTEGFTHSRCMSCFKWAFWQAEKMIYPLVSIAPLASRDMPEEITQDYNEARTVLAISPRSSAALLRLAIQKLCRHLGYPGRNINEDIRAMVANGLAPSIQQALDSVRVIGNNAVHPGQIDLDDSPEIALALFKAVNFIVHQIITVRREMEELYSTLPENIRQNIDRQDGRA